MTTQLQRRLSILARPENQALLAQGLRGIERETLRFGMHQQQPTLAQTPHPLAWGSALTHPHITTDYAETLVEFITPAEHDIGLALEKLDESHRFAYQHLPGEMLWSQSMPLPLPEEDKIAIAWYGKSNIGMLKHVYRRGLALRYGKAMQCIAGIHYNFSVSEDLWKLLQKEEGCCDLPIKSQSESYIAMIRNFRRYSWLLMFLFGASPALARSFLRGRQHHLETLSEDTLYLPYATSLRMSDLGYQNDAQAGLTPQENSLENYVETLAAAVRQPYARYAELGTKRDGEWVQLSTNVLQIENEYYSTIRPKRVIRTGERPIQALCRRGVQYIEVRCMDVDPYHPLGISLETARFLDAFLLFCALDESALNTDAESRENQANFALVVKDGRRPGLQLQHQGSAIGLPQWGEQLLDLMTPVAQLLDVQRGGNVHMAALAAQRAKLRDYSLTPSSRVLADLAQFGQSFPRFGLHQSQLHADNFKARPLSARQQAYYLDLASTSLSDQEDVELKQTGSLDDFIHAYQASTLCHPCSVRDIKLLDEPASLLE
ncbi:MAG: Glutamate--cysteine ligase [Pseudomonadota bacterium]